MIKIFNDKDIIILTIDKHPFNYMLFCKQHFRKQHQAEFGKKNQAKAKQHSETELLLLENNSLSSSTLLSKNNGKYSKKCAKNKSHTCAIPKQHLKLIS